MLPLFYRCRSLPVGVSRCWQLAGSRLMAVTTAFGALVKEQAVRSVCAALPAEIEQAADLRGSFFFRHWRLCLGGAVDHVDRPGQSALLRCVVRLHSLEESTLQPAFKTGGHKFATRCPRAAGPLVHLPVRTPSAASSDPGSPTTLPQHMPRTPVSTIEAMSTAVLATTPRTSPPTNLSRRLGASVQYC